MKSLLRPGRRQPSPIDCHKAARTDRRSRKSADTYGASTRLHSILIVYQIDINYSFEQWQRIRQAEVKEVNRPRPDPPG
ncbi:MAG: hypothetical protein GVY11_04475 [Gammaproteobacteria bacterium]|nr:hypothetical protein [Gammaproteobacteria bacterium]